MPLQDHMKLVSVDDHLIEHPNVFQDRLPKNFRELGPRIVELEDGAQVWQYEDRQYPTLGLNAVAGRPFEEFGNEPARYDEMIKGSFDPVARLADMDLEGVWAHLCFPTFPRFAGTLFLEGEDRELALLCVQAWNDFVLDEWCAADPARFIPLSIMPLWDPILAADEIRRVAAKGSKTITIPENMSPLGLPSFHTDHWNPVFEASVETGLPLSMHFGTSSLRPPHSPDAPFAVIVGSMGVNSMLAFADLVFSPTFHNYPDLKVVLSEGGIGWMPYMMERLTTTWTRHRFYTGINVDVPPMDLIERNIFGCFIQDDAGIANRHLIGIDRIMWECDYPHSDCLFPHSRKYLAESLADVLDDEAHKIVELNARRIFNFPG
jgi:predicted TIM-barrel fold metal-dependent hydrolase